MNIYLYFNGDCETAFNHYKNVFGGEFASLQRFADAPADADMPDRVKQLIMHVSLPLKDGLLMGSDGISKIDWGNNFAIVYPASSRQDCDDTFAALSKEGEVTMALQETFWGSYYGSCVDKFGVNWMFNLDLSGN